MYPTSVKLGKQNLNPYRQDCCGVYTMDRNKRIRRYSDGFATRYCFTIHHATSIVSGVCWMIADMYRFLEEGPGSKTNVV